MFYIIGCIKNSFSGTKWAVCGIPKRHDKPRVNMRPIDTKAPGTTLNFTRCIRGFVSIEHALYDKMGMQYIPAF